MFSLNYYGTSSTREDNQSKHSIFTGQCQVPVIPNGTLVGGRESVYVNHGVEIEYQCNNGLVPHKGSSMKCNNGTWTSTAKCVPCKYLWVFKVHVSKH